MILQLSPNLDVVQCLRTAMISNAMLTGVLDSWQVQLSPNLDVVQWLAYLHDLK
jgi:hypothetical protein